MIPEVEAAPFEHEPAAVIGGGEHRAAADFGQVGDRVRDAVVAVGLRRRVFRGVGGQRVLRLEDGGGSVGRAEHVLAAFPVEAGRGPVCAGGRRFAVFGTGHKCRVAAVTDVELGRPESGARIRAEEVERAPVVGDHSPVRLGGSVFRFAIERARFHVGRRGAPFGLFAVGERVGVPQFVAVVFVEPPAPGDAGLIAGQERLLVPEVDPFDVWRAAQRDRHLDARAGKWRFRVRQHGLADPFDRFFFAEPASVGAAGCEQVRAFGVFLGPTDVCRPEDPVQVGGEEHAPGVVGDCVDVRYVSAGNCAFRRPAFRSAARQRVCLQPRFCLPFQGPAGVVHERAAVGRGHREAPHAGGFREAGVVTALLDRCDHLVGATWGAPGRSA